MNKANALKIRTEIKSMLEILSDLEGRINEELKQPWYKKNNLKDMELSGTSESSALKSAYKAMKYKLDKLIL